MHRRHLWLSVTALGLVSGCAAFEPPKYVEPSVQAPHAMVFLRMSLPEANADLVEQGVAIDGRDLPVTVTAQDLVVRIEPGAPQWGFATRFYQLKTTTETEDVPVSVSVRDSCASRNYKNQCESGYRYETQNRLQSVTRIRPVTTRSCSRGGQFSFVAGRTYRVSYTMTATELCEVTCMDTTDGPSGTPCPTPPPTFASTKATTKPTQETTRPLRPLGTAALVIGGLGILGGALAAHVAKQKQEAVAGHCDAYKTCDAEGLTAAEEGRTAATVGAVSLGIGGALLLGGIGILVFGPSKPVVTVQGSQVGLGGRF